VLVRMRGSLKARLVELAKREHRSLNQQIEFLLEHSILGSNQRSSTEQEENGKARQKHRS
jgi:hypothetical protein